MTAGGRKSFKPEKAQLQNEKSTLGRKRLEENALDKVGCEKAFIIIVLKLQMFSVPAFSVFDFLLRVFSQSEYFCFNRQFLSSLRFSKCEQNTSKLFCFEKSRKR
ncbi:hypothetical protein [Bartonella apis]|uniref:hypothetical protein n=1 Tax=Bartonella apis TaxID=1686310 RepID=UPI002432354E|nr:hypothetical protein [Bartonella apis]